ncbi:MAG: nucleoside hydrolase [Cytophagales bacterium]|nr:nucleoside hydrolase [Cytophagales bacterium]
MHLIRLFALLIAFLIIASCTAQKERLPLIIDADTANEVDDLFALVRAIEAPEFDLLGITSAQFHTSPLASEQSANESQTINEDLIRLLDKKDLPLPLGSNQPLQAVDQPQTSEASRFIIEKAHAMKENQKLHLVILGSCTNVASAILMDPTIVPKIQVHYLGFWHTLATNQYDKKEFNSGNDTLAVNFLLDHPTLDLSVMTATTSQHLMFNKKVVDQQLKGKGGIHDYLVNRWETYDRWWTEEDPEKTEWIMWDVAIIEALAHPEWATTQTFLTPPENTPREIKIHTSIDTQQMEADFWEHMHKLSNK